MNFVRAAGTDRHAANHKLENACDVVVEGFNIIRRNFFACGEDDVVLYSSGNMVKTLFVHNRSVTGKKPTIVKGSSS